MCPNFFLSTPAVFTHIPYQTMKLHSQALVAFSLSHLRSRTAPKRTRLAPLVSNAPPQPTDVASLGIFPSYDDVKDSIGLVENSRISPAFIQPYVVSAPEVGDVIVGKPEKSKQKAMEKVIHHSAFGIFLSLYGLFFHQLLLNGSAYWPMICGTFWSVYEIYYGYFSPLRKGGASRLHNKLYSSFSVTLNLLSVWFGYGAEMDELGIFPLHTLTQRIAAAANWTFFWVSLQIVVDRLFRNKPLELTKIKYWNFVSWPLTAALMVRLPSWQPQECGLLPDVFSLSPKAHLFLPYGSDVLRNGLMLLAVVSTAAYGIVKVPIFSGYDLGKKERGNHQQSAFEQMKCPNGGVFRTYVTSIVLCSPLVFSLVGPLHTMNQFAFSTIIAGMSAIGFCHLLRNVSKKQTRGAWEEFLEVQTTKMSDAITFQNYRGFLQTMRFRASGPSHHLKNVVFGLSKFLSHDNPVAWSAFSASEYAGVAAYSSRSLTATASTFLLLVMGNLLDYSHDAFKDHGNNESNSKRNSFIRNNKALIVGVWASSFIVNALLLRKTPLVFAAQWLFMLIGAGLYKKTKKLFVGSKAMYSGLLGATVTTIFPLLIDRTSVMQPILSVETLILFFAASTRLAATEVMVDTFDLKFDKNGDVPTLPIAFGIPSALRIACALYGVSSLASWLALSGNMVIPSIVWALGAWAAEDRLKWMERAATLFVLPVALSALGKAF